MNEISLAFKKTLIWFFGNACFGLAPLLFMLLVNVVTDGKAEEEIKHLSEGGVVLFVSIAITGSVVIDILNGNYGFKNLNRFLLEISPFIMLFFVLFIYLLLVLKQTSGNYFSSSSYFYKFIIGFSAIYCILAKYTMFIRERKGGVK